MKRIILLLTTICMAVAGHAAQDYVPMVQEGKQWLYGRGDWGQYTGPSFSYLLEGDTMIGDKAYIKMFKQTEGIAGRTYYAALREIDRRVYAVMPGQDSERLVYDYNLIQEGCTSEYENGDVATSLGVLWTARGSDGLPHRLFCVHITNPNSVLMPTGGPIWVEGVGHIDEGERQEASGEVKVNV